MDAVKLNNNVKIILYYRQKNKHPSSGRRPNPQKRTIRPHPDKDKRKKGIRLIAECL